MDDLSKIVLNKKSSASISIKKNHETQIIILLIIILVAVFFISLTVGRYTIPLDQIFNIIYSKLFNLPITCPPAVESVLFKVRLPRVISAILVGSSLSISGAAYQGLFKNPMVSPDILGASAGAGFGSALAILLSFNIIAIQFSSFAFGLAAVTFTYLLGKIISHGNNSVVVLVLIGMVVSNLFTAFISIIKYVADTDNKLPAITFWLLGGLSSVTFKDLRIIIFPIIISIIPLILLRWQMNVISFGDEEAASLGINTSKMKAIVIICSSLLTAAAVSISGMVGWIGLIIPHLARMIVGPNYKTLLPASLLLGSIFLLLVDDLARSMFPVEIPLGILTSLIGAPFFIYLLLKGRRSWL